MTNQVKKTTERIAQTIRLDKTIKHCRINVVNGANKIFQKYKDVLTTIDNEYISVRLYENYTKLHQDLFRDSNFMSPYWFNLIVFNISAEKDSIKNEICGVELITKIMHEKFDSKYYSILLVSPVIKEDMRNLYEKTTGQNYPVMNHRYLGYNFNSIQVLDYLDQIIHTHSTQFLSRWEKALSRLENLPNQSYSLAGSM